MSISIRNMRHNFVANVVDDLCHDGKGRNGVRAGALLLDLWFVARKPSSTCWGHPDNPKLETKSQAGND